jgi:hypothetical protein
MTRLLPTRAESSARNCRSAKTINTFRRPFSIGITFPVSNSGSDCRYHAPSRGSSAAVVCPPARPVPLPGPRVTPPLMPGIMDLGYLDAGSRARLALTRLRRHAADTTLEG